MIREGGVNVPDGHEAKNIVTMTTTIVIHKMMMVLMTMMMVLMTIR